MREFPEEVMRKGCAVLALLLSLSIGQDVLLACGDKFFLVGRGDRFSRAYASLSPGNILIYTGGTSDISKGLRDPRLHKFINRAGHRVLLASDRAELKRVLEAESVDVILAAYGQAVALIPDVASARSQPTLLPIEGKADARVTSPDPFTARLKSSDKVNRFLAGIEDVMKTRAKDKSSRG
jgi:hypothetical protein